jgi:UDP-galactopyranose mutase
MNLNNIKFLIVGSGFYGAVLAERIANDLGETVAIIEKRDHIGGNCFSTKNLETNICYHRYGTHIFHTSNKVVWDYLNQFTEFNSYTHHVLTTYKNKVYQMPINLETINSFYGLNLKPFEVDEFLEKEIQRDYFQNPKNFEEVAVNKMGRALYEAFIKGYTQKQWQKKPSELPANILMRLPFRKNYNESYFNSRWQGIPPDGYTEIFNKLLANPKIKVYKELDYFDIKDDLPKHLSIIFTGAIDSYFDYQFGRLEWRSLKFEYEVVPVADYQGTSVMNYAEKEIPYTRIHEPKHLHEEKKHIKNKTLIIREYPDHNNNQPYYPINTETNQNKVRKYQAESKKQPNIIFGGRLGSYQYLDMDETIAAALSTYEQVIKFKALNC